jgi:hypothetical protein
LWGLFWLPSPRSNCSLCIVLTAARSGPLPLSPPTCSPAVGRIGVPSFSRSSSSLVRLSFSCLYGCLTQWFNLCCLAFAVAAVVGHLGPFSTVVSEDQVCLNKIPPPTDLSPSSSAPLTPTPLKTRLPSPRFRRRLA